MRRYWNLFLCVGITLCVTCATHAADVVSEGSYANYKAILTDRTGVNVWPDTFVCDVRVNTSKQALTLLYAVATPANTSTPTTTPTPTDTPTGGTQTPTSTPTGNTRTPTKTLTATPIEVIVGLPPIANQIKFPDDLPRSGHEAHLISCIWSKDGIQTTHQYEYLVQDLPGISVSSGTPIPAATPTP